MLDLYVIRHANAEYDSFSNRDFDRRLTEKGIRHARKMGRQLAKNIIKSVKIITSPAKRAFQTTEIIADELNYPTTDILSLAEIYEASLIKLLALINHFDNQNSSIILVGHNPGLSDLCEYISGNSIQLATAEVASFHFELDDWLAVCENSGSLFLSIDPGSSG